MGWELVSENSAGYKKYRDNYGNLRYQKPNGTFTSRQSWSGSFAQEGVEETTKDDIDYGDIGTGESSPWDKEEIEPKSYARVTRFVINEPYKRKHPAPLDNPFPGRGYLLDEYPIQERLDMMGKKFEETNYEMYAFGVYSIIVEDNTISSGGERFTNHSDNLTNLKANFKQVISEIMTALNSSPGSVALITKTFVVGMDYE